MTGNPRDSKWYSTPRSARRRRGVEIMLGDEARARLDEIAEASGRSLSAVVEELILGTIHRSKRGKP